MMTFSWTSSLLCMLLVVAVTTTAGQDGQPEVRHNITFSPASLLLTEWSHETVSYDLRWTPMEGYPVRSTPIVEVLSSDNDVVRILNQSQAGDGITRAWITMSGQFTVQARWLGRTSVLLSTNALTNSSSILAYPVVVVRTPRVIDAIFDHVVTVIVVVSNLMFGCMFDLTIARKILRRPVAPSIGFVCQYGFMPSFSFLLGWALQLPTAQRLGLLGVGCSPGGGMSNVWTLNLDGDVTLSLVMTFVSNMCALFMMPLWLLTLGQHILGGSVSIPFLNVILTIIIFVLPILIGIGIARWKPSVKGFVEKILRPFTIIEVIFILGVGLYSNAYAFRFFTHWRLPVSGMLLPYAGLFCGMVAACAFRQSRQQVVTIGIETAIQNAAIALVLLRRSLPQPEADIAAVLPIVAFLLTPIPFIVAFIILTVKKACGDKKKRGPYEPAPAVDDHSDWETTT